MKAVNAVSIFNNLVGVEVCNIQDVVKAQAAGLVFVNKDGLYYYDYYLVEENGEEREPTEQEVFDRIAKDLADDKEVYACMHIAEDWCVMTNTNTNLQSKFGIGQIVYTMHENKIVQGEIIYLTLSQGHLEEKAVKARYDGMAEKLFHFISNYDTNGSFSGRSYYIQEQIAKKIGSLDMGDYVVLKSEKDHYPTYLTRGIKEIFATKEQLVDNLMKN